MRIKAIAIISIMAASMATAQNISYPKAQKDGTVDEYFGVKVADPYRWMEDDRSEQTAAWVEAENKVTNDYLSRIPFRSKILKRLTEVDNYEKVGVPAWYNGKWYFSRNDGLQNQSVVYVMDQLGGKERVFLDPNKLSDDGTVALKDITHSHDGRYAAYAISRNGSDWVEMYVIDKQTGQTLSDHIMWSKFSSPTWWKDGFFYSAYDAPTEGSEFSSRNQTQKIYYHKVGTPQSEDILFYQNPSRPLSIYVVSVNEKETMMFLEEYGATKGINLYVKDLRQEGSQLIQIADGMNYIYSLIETIGDKIYILTNDNAPNYRVMVADLKHLAKSEWQELVPEQQSVLTGAQIIDGHLMLTYLQDASSHIYVHSLDGKRLREIKLPSVGSANIYGRNDRKECFYSFTSFTEPGSIYQYDVESDHSTLYNSPKVNFRKGDFQTEQVFFNSKDGTRIPMFLTYKKGMKRNGKNPVMMYGYGGFSVNKLPSFASSLIPLLEKGFIYAHVTLRGGGEYGEKWHEAGTKMKKQNVFDDFIGAAEWLISNKYTNSKRLAIRGGSNGGLLVGACMTQRPELFKVVLAQVGVMDMLRYHKFTIGWNWANDYGTSEDSREMFEYLKGYSPLHNLKPGTAYPATMVCTADHDDRVVPAHSFKFAATLQECNDGTNPTLIRIDSNAGHGGGKPLSKVLEEYADMYSFMMYNMGLKY